MFSLDSSLVLVAVVGLWLVGVAPFVLGTATPDFTGTTHPTHAGTRRPTENMMTMSVPQDEQAGRRGGPSAGRTGPDPDTGVSAARGAVRRRLASPEFAGVHRGRLGVALIGALALLSIPVSLVLAVLGVVSLLVPMIGLAVTVAAVVTLRFLAVRGRRARVAPVSAGATALQRAGADPVARLVPAVPARPTTLFDAEEAPVRPATAMERRTAALAVAHGATAVEVGAAAPDASPNAAADASPEAAADVSPDATAWAPVDVPRPTYVDAARAERQAPEPLQLPEAPKATSRMPIKASEAAARAVAAADDAGPLPSADAPATGRIDLDDVLQRRRA